MPSLNSGNETLLKRARAASRLPKADLLFRLVDRGVLTGAQAEQAARGEIPAAFEAFVASLTQPAQESARIKWAADTEISRMHPVIVAGAAAIGMNSETLDDLFGVDLSGENP